MPGDPKRALWTAQAADLVPFTDRQKMEYRRKDEKGAHSIGEEAIKVMKQADMPFMLRTWLLTTRALAFPMRRISRRAHIRMGADPARFTERLGRASQHAAGPVIWFHAASLGEVAQIKPLVAGLGRPQQEQILVTTTTEAGAEWVRRELPDAIHQFAPMDTPSAVTSFLDAWNISVAVFIEGDFGPRLSLAARKRGIPQILLNARHSRTRERFPAAFAALLSGFSLITCRSQQVADGLHAIGVPGARVKVLPDLRVATGKLPRPAELLATMTEHIGTRPVWLAASTHPADESAVLSAHQQVIAASKDALLILAPRHPKRGDLIQQAAQSMGFNVARRSDGETLTRDTQVYLADTLGELGVFFSITPVAFLGGSFGDEGGHNPYEPASFGCAILSGANVKNFVDAYDALSTIGAADLVDDPASLGSRVLALLDSDKAKTMGRAGQSFVEASENSVQETIALIDNILTDRS